MVLRNEGETVNFLGLAELFKELHYKISVPFEMVSDCACQVLQRRGPGGLEHIEIRCSAILAVGRVDTKNNTADLFTNIVEGPRSQSLSKKLGSHVNEDMDD